MKCKFKGGRDEVTKKELREYYWLKRNIQRLKEKLIELEPKAMKVTTMISNKPRILNVEDKMATAVAEMVDIKTIMSNKIRQSVDILINIEGAVEVLPERQKYLIRARYIDCKKWEEICVDMNYSWRQIHNIHSEALTQLKIAHNCTS